MTQSLLIYDGSRPGFRAIADIATRGTDDLEPIAWQSDRVQAFLDAQFDEQPFAFILVEDEFVHVGENAVERLLQTYGLGDSVSGLFKRAYPPFSAPFGRLVHGKEPTDIHGSFPLAPEARDHLDQLRGRTIPVTEE